MGHVTLKAESLQGWHPLLFRAISSFIIKAFCVSLAASIYTASAFLAFLKA